MRVAQPAVLVGAYDWDEKFIPRAEFEARVKQVFSKLADKGLAGLVVYGNKVDNAALAYLTNFAPKIESGLALVTQDGKVRIHGSGSPQMMVNAKRLTWVEDVRPLRDPAKNIAEWADEAGQGPLGFWTSEAMPGDLLPKIEAGLGARKLVDVSATLNALLREKSPVALALTRDACGMLDKAAAAVKEWFHGASAREAAIAAEKAATKAGAQDVRVLISLAKGGTPTAIDYPDGGKLDPLLAYIAVRHAGYWADGFLTLSSTANPTLERTQAALKAMLATAKAGTSVAELRDAAQSALGGLAIHPAARKPAVGIGLMLEETEAEPGGVAKLEAGRVYSLRAGAQVSATDNALLSAMIVPKAGGVDVLWSALG